ncbi:MAG: TetR/AcrR family transcriptional regulator [Acidimicrobiales bacterium]
MPKIGGEARESRRQQLIDAAWRCVDRVGYHNLTIDDVCAESNLSKGAFYTYFKQKQDLFVALLDEDAAALEAIINDLGATDLSAIERIRRFLRAVLERGQDNAVVQMRADLWAEVRDDPDVQKRFSETVSERRRVLAGWIDDAVRSGEMVDIPPNAFASILLALADGLMLHSSIDPRGFRWANIRTGVRVLLDGITSGGTEFAGPEVV